MFHIELFEKRRLLNQSEERTIVDLQGEEDCKDHPKRGKQRARSGSKENEGKEIAVGRERERERRTKLRFMIRTRT